MKLQPNYSGRSTGMATMARYGGLCAMSKGRREMTREEIRSQYKKEESEEKNNDKS